MSGWVEANANVIFDILVSDPKLIKLADMLAMREDKVNDFDIEAFKTNILPQILAMADDTRCVTNPLMGDKHPIDKFDSNRVIGCALRRYRRDSRRYMQE